jgi:hypothetical protein
MAPSSWLRRRRRGRAEGVAALAVGAAAPTISTPDYKRRSATAYQSVLRFAGTDPAPSSTRAEATACAGEGAPNPTTRPPRPRRRRRRWQLKAFSTEFLFVGDDADDPLPWDQDGGPLLGEKRTRRRRAWWTDRSALDRASPVAWTRTVPPCPAASHCRLFCVLSGVRKRVPSACARPGRPTCTFELRPPGHTQ